VAAELQVGSAGQAVQCFIWVADVKFNSALSIHLSKFFALNIEILISPPSVDQLLRLNGGWDRLAKQSNASYGPQM